MPICFKISIKFKNVPTNMDEFVNNVIEEKIDIMMTPAIASQFIKYSSLMNILDKNFVNSVFVDFFEMASIASKILPGVQYQALFSYFKCFRIEVWSLIFTTMLFLTLLSVWQTKNFKDFSNFLWNYFILMFGNPSKNFLNRKKIKYFVAIWLMSVLLLSNDFTASILVFMVRAIPELKIDSLEQLSRRTDLKIIVRDDSGLVAFTEKVDSELARSLAKQLDTFNNYGQVVDKLVNGLRDGSIAYINPRLTLIFGLISLSQMKKRTANEESLTDVVHISEGNDGLEPYFILINNKTDDQIKRCMNKL